MHFTVKIRSYESAASRDRAAQGILEAFGIDKDLYIGADASVRIFSEEVVSDVLRSIAENNTLRQYPPGYVIRTFGSWEALTSYLGFEPWDPLEDDPGFISTDPGASLPGAEGTGFYTAHCRGNKDGSVDLFRVLVRYTAYCEDIPVTVDLEIGSQIISESAVRTDSQDKTETEISFLHDGLQYWLKIKSESQDAAAEISEYIWKLAKTQ